VFRNGEQARLVGLERRKARQLTWAKRHNGGRYSNRLRRTITEIARLRARQARRRADFTHKLTSDLAKKHGFVGIKDLQVKAMIASARGTVEDPGKNVAPKAGLNPGILDNSHGERRRQLTYKCPRYGSVLVRVPPHGTSQTCPACGVRGPKSRPGCGWEFACAHCGYQGHADRVAAINIERRGQLLGPEGPSLPSSAPVAQGSLAIHSFPSGLLGLLSARRPQLGRSPMGTVMRQQEGPCGVRQRESLPNPRHRCVG